MNRLIPLVPLLLSPVLVLAQPTSTVGFDKPRYDIAIGETFETKVLIDPVPPSGVSSFGVRLDFETNSAQIINPDAVLTAPALDFFGVSGVGALKAVGPGFGAAKGTVNFFAEAPGRETNALLVTFLITDQGTNSYELRLGFFNTLGPTEDIMVDGQGNVFDDSITFGSALVNHRPLIQITNPPSGTIFDVPALVRLTAEARDVDGSVMSVQFFEGANLLGEVASEPFSITLTNLVSGTHIITALARDNLGATGASSNISFTITGGQPLEIASPLQLNHQTGLFEQNVRVRNIQAGPFAAVRLSIRGLPNDVRVFNASGLEGGVPFVQSNQPLAPGASVDFKIEYFIPDRRVINQPDLVAEVVSASQPAEPIGMIFSVNRSLRLGDGTFLVEFSSLANRSYAIQYSPDLANWKTAVPAIAGNGSWVQWIDSGPPKTETLPTAGQDRFYRIVLLP